MHTLRLSKRAQKDLKNLDKLEMTKALQALRQLSTDPHAGHTLAGSLRGVRSLEFSTPGGAYRAAYVISGEECIVFLVGSHEGFYKKAERRYEALWNIDKS